MTVMTIDETPALVVIDLQKGIVARPSVHPLEDIVANSAPAWPRPSAHTACRSSS